MQCKTTEGRSEPHELYKSKSGILQGASHTQCIKRSNILQAVRHTPCKTSKRWILHKDNENIHDIIRTP